MASSIKQAKPETVGVFDQTLIDFESEGVTVRNLSDYGDGYVMVTDKDQLVGKPFIITDYHEIDGDFGSYSLIRLVTQSGERFILTDGSTGIHAQLQNLVADGVPVKGILVGRGLRRSDYDYTDKDGKVTPAHTFYLSA